MTYLSYRQTGTGNPLLLLHAMPLDSTMFDRLRTHLGAVLTVDAPGFGQSPPASIIDDALGAEQPSLDTYAAAVISDLRELGIDRCTIGGLSMGGAVAMSILEQAPSLVAGLILMDTNIGADTEAARQKRLDAAIRADSGDTSTVLGMAETMTSRETRQDRADVYEDVKRRLAEVRPDSLAWIQRAMAGRPDRRPLIDSFDGPLTLIRGLEDAACTADMMSDLANRYRGAASVHTIPGAGHFTALEKPRELADLL
ncbi:alpha/beta fold hydrolase [Flaviflexus equikiangi]|uniref:Alpha/beta hydrolase n=2 Tax=Flaviflexus equikiangi TaxID=2758573 RepID=A0ABS2TFP5_9ACTO|nr:alpha/beta hydrolase [Flaviflexus equikiangi]MBM9433474.1 alpha/beta hydrolase [Flaviflexus equikiangi]